MPTFLLNDGSQFVWEPTTDLLCSGCHEGFDIRTRRKDAMRSVNFMFDFDHPSGDAIAAGEYFYLHKHCASLDTGLRRYGVKVRWGWWGITQVLGIDRNLAEYFGRLDVMLRKQMPPGCYDRLYKQWLPSRDTAQHVRPQTLKQLLPAVRTPRPGYVYIVEALGSGRIKIGHGRNVTARLQQLSTGTPFPLRLLRAIETADSLGLEQQLHRRYSAYHVHNEWYVLPENIMVALLQEAF